MKGGGGQAPRATVPQEGGGGGSVLCTTQKTWPKRAVACALGVGVPACRVWPCAASRPRPRADSAVNLNAAIQPLQAIGFLEGGQSWGGGVRKPNLHGKCRGRLVGWGLAGRAGRAERGWGRNSLTGGSREAGRPQRGPSPAEICGQWRHTERCCSCGFWFDVKHVHILEVRDLRTGKIWSQTSLDRSLKMTETIWAPDYYG